MTAMSLHGEWLSLMDISGPFLAEPVLKDVFPQGLEEVDPATRKMLRQAYEEWRDALELGDPDLDKLHAAWIDIVLRQGLELDDDGSGDVLKSGDELPDTLAHTFAEQGVTLRPDYAVVDDRENDKSLMLVSVYEPETDLNEPLKKDGWAASPAERMVELCRAKGTRLGLVTNGEHWMLVDAPVGAVTTFASWYARLWGPEPKTLQSFINLLSVRRFFVGSDEQLPALLDASLKLQDEVTDALGEQVRRAVEVLIQALDRADVDRNRELLNGIEPTALYEAGLTVMMRIVFLLSAEERGLLLLGDERYEANYAVSTLRMQLRAESEEILERRFDAWARLLAIFRAVYGGIEHDELRLPALGGSLFDPNRFPFLEGRATGSDWRSDHAIPLPIDNRTVLLLLDAVQLFQGRTLSYRALDVEQIGYVYEGLLERTVVRAKEVTLDLDATKSAKQPWVTLDELEAAQAKSDDALAALLKERTGSSASRVKNDLAKDVDAADADQLLTACHADAALRDRIKPYFHLLRIDRWGYPLVYPVDTFMVTTGTDRRETGTHYTPKSLTEAIVKETLEPVAYVGPAEGKPREEWALKSPAELLDLKICDPAMGSGAFLVQVCRWLSDRLVEAWREAEDAGKAVTADGEVVAQQGGYEPLRDDPEERLLTARRLIAERCLYGVDVNPLAVELAKLSIWLITLAKGRPFGFLDHNLRSGDSLLGIHNLDQLLYLDMHPGKGSSKKLFASKIDKAVEEAVALRAELRRRPIIDIRDVEAMQELDGLARRKLEIPELIADALVGGVLAASGKIADTTSLSIEAGKVIAGEADAVELMRGGAVENLRVDLPPGKSDRRPFHWPIEFPEVFRRENSGFDAFVGNPPFLGNSSWKASLGKCYSHIIEGILGQKAGKIDLSVVFHRLALSLTRGKGCYGLIGANNICEGQAVKVGLSKICLHGDIVSADRDVVWPGGASVISASVVFFKGAFGGARKLNGVPVGAINERLQEASLSAWEVKPLKNPLFAFKGVDNSKGLAFVITKNSPWHQRLSEERQSLLRPYVTGNDITSTDMQDFERWALDIGDRHLDDIKGTHPVAHDFLIEEVLPTRSADDLKSYKGLVDRWWQFWNPRTKQFARIRKREKAVCYCRTTKHPIGLSLDTKNIYTEGVVIVEQSSVDVLAICQSAFFAEWLVKTQGAKFGVGGTLRLSLRDGISTFPYPTRPISADGCSAAVQLDGLIKQWCIKNGTGVTAFGNELANEDSTCELVVRARKLYSRVTDEVAAAYGFDREIKYGFHKAPYIVHKAENAYCVSGEARAQINDFLSEQNKYRFEANANLALRPGRRSSKAPKSDLEDDLFSIQGRG